MSGPIQNNLTTTQQVNTSANNTSNTSVSSPANSGSAGLVDVLEQFASALTGQSNSGSSLLSQGNQASQGTQLSTSLTEALLEFALALAEHTTQSSGSSSANNSNTTQNNQTQNNTNRTSTTNPTNAGGNNSNTSSTFSLNLAPAASTQASAFTQAGASLITNMPASTLANVNINQYTGDAMRAMQSAGYSQDQITNFMTGMDQAYAQRTMPAGGSSNSGGTTNNNNRPTYNPQLNKT